MKKVVLVFFLFFLSLEVEAQSKQRLDSLIIEATLDPGSGPDFNLIKIYFGKKEFVVNYLFYDSFDELGFDNDPEIVKIRKASRESENYDFVDQYLDKISKIRESYVMFYTKKIILENKKYRKYLSDLNMIFNLSQDDIEREKSEKNIYLHGVFFRSDFFKNNIKKRFFASSLREDNFGTIYKMLIQTLDLYRKQYSDEKFDGKTFGY